MTAIAYVDPANVYRRKSKKCFWFLNPTQLFTQGQWWSILATQPLQVEQWWAFGGFKASHFLHLWSNILLINSQALSDNIIFDADCPEELTLFIEESFKLSSWL